MAGASLHRESIAQILPLRCAGVEVNTGCFLPWQVYIRIKDDEWNVYRRYTEFRSLHHKLQNTYPQVQAYSFPPKKAIGNKVPSSGRGPQLCGLSV